MTTTTAPDFAAIAEHLAASGVTTEPLGCCRDHPDVQRGLAVPDRDGVWIYFQQFDNGWDLCTGTYPPAGLDDEALLNWRGKRTHLEIGDLEDPRQVAEAIKAAVDGGAR